MQILSIMFSMMTMLCEDSGKYIGTVLHVSAYKCVECAHELCQDFAQKSGKRFIS